MGRGLKRLEKYLTEELELFVRKIRWSSRNNPRPCFAETVLVRIPINHAEHFFCNKLVRLYNRTGTGWL